MVAEHFIPHPLLRSGHAQTIAGWALPRRIALPPPEGRLFDVAPGVQVLCRCNFQIQKSKVKSQKRANDERPSSNDSPLTLLLVHGLEGSSESKYVLGAAQLAFTAGMNVVRMNIRNCGGTERLSRTLYHSGLSQDIGVVAAALAEGERAGAIAIAGFSLGGNQVLKLAGEWGSAPPPSVRAVAAVSPAMDLDASCDLLHAPGNRIYEWQFLRSLKQRMKLKAELFPQEVEPSLRGIRSMREFDDRVTAPAFGFTGAADYYAKVSASPLLNHISVPALVIYALDDPFICLLPETRARLRDNRNITAIECQHGGHCAFIGQRGRRWAEEQIINFVAEVRN